MPGEVVTGQAPDAEAVAACPLHRLFPLAVSVELIRAAPADTTPECVAFATCWAVWDALGDPGAVPVQIEGGQILFDGRPLSSMGG